MTADTPHFSIHQLPVQGALQPSVRALLGVEIHGGGPLPLAIAPHDSVMLSVQLGRGSQPIEQKGGLGRNTRLTGIRQWTGTFQGAGDCVTLFAMLTPLGAMQLLESQPLSGVPRIRAALADLLDSRITSSLEAQVAQVRSQGVPAQLQVFAQWLEQRALRQRRQDSAGLRAARAAMRLCAEPAAAVEALAAEQQVSRRQLERDFARWIGTSPRHLSQVARLQGVSRAAMRGDSLADAAADVGFADQAHMSRVVRQLTGMTPRHFVRSQRTPMAQAFRTATRGGTVYL